MSALFQSTTVVPDTYLADLRAALRAKFALLTETDDLARLWTMRMSVRGAFDMHAPETLIKQLISDVDVSDDPDLQSLKDEMLALTQWSV